ncbi:hypothetical protein Tco_0689745 [Tanacetum coccineum]
MVRAGSGKGWCRRPELGSSPPPLPSPRDHPPGQSLEVRPQSVRSMPSNQLIMEQVKQELVMLEPLPAPGHRQLVEHTLKNVKQPQMHQTHTRASNECPMVIHQHLTQRCRLPVLKKSIAV